MSSSRQSVLLPPNSRSVAGQRLYRSTPNTTLIAKSASEPNEGRSAGKLAGPPSWFLGAIRPLAKCYGIIGSRSHHSLPDALAIIGCRYSTASDERASHRGPEVLPPRTEHCEFGIGGRA